MKKECVGGRRRFREPECELMSMLNGARDEKWIDKAEEDTLRVWYFLKALGMRRDLNVPKFAQIAVIRKE